MISLNNISSVYFVGIGGIGMSALARYFHEQKLVVRGYDKTPTELTQELVDEGIEINFKDDLSSLDKEANLVVYTPAIPKDHQQLNWYRENDFTVVKRSDVLESITHQMQAVCVAGTHGKTTVSTMIAHLLRDAAYGCNAFLGGISVNYKKNFWSSANQCAVVEADEYDRSFLKLHPDFAVLTAMDADHLDIYGTVEEMEKCYLQFINSVQDTLIFKHGLKRSSEFKVKNQFTYSAQNDSADYYAKDIMMSNGSYAFDIYQRDELKTSAVLHMGGMHNVENCIAAFALCDVLGVDVVKLAKGISSFKGVKRRFQYIVKNDNFVYIDDYAHHPEELKNLIESAKALFRNRKLAVIFQPHLYSRTKDLSAGFAESLDLADEVILLDIYPARELPMEGVSSELIMDQMHSDNKNLLTMDGAMAWVEGKKPELLITAGAGDIDTLVEPIKQKILAL